MRGSRPSAFPTREVGLGRAVSQAPRCRACGLAPVRHSACWTPHPATAGARMPVVRETSIPRTTTNLAFTATSLLHQFDHLVHIDSEFDRKWQTD
jgi:hypothetical protein